MDIIEKRKQDRFQVEAGAVVEFSKPRFLNLGKPRVVKSAPIVNISGGGLAFEYEGRKMWSVEYQDLSITLKDGILRIENLPIKVISDRMVGNPLVSDRKRRCGVRFNSLSPEQKSQIRYILHHHTTEKQPIQIFQNFSELPDPIRL